MAFLSISPSKVNSMIMSKPFRSSATMRSRTTAISFLTKVSRRGWQRGPCSSSGLTVGLGHASTSPEALGQPQEEEGPVVLKIGIIGFGNFGQFIAKGIHAGAMSCWLRPDPTTPSIAPNMGYISFSKSIDALCEQQPDIILICSSILSTENVVREIPTHKLRPDINFADVLSVKQFPKKLLLGVLPPEFGIVCTHPMFGPESGKHGWTGLPFVFDKVRIAHDCAQASKCATFLSIFEHEGCKMVEMSCEEHDHHAASSQFITHTIGRILSHLNLESTPINTKGYETLLQLTENTVSDSLDLYYRPFMCNSNAREQIENLDRAFKMVKQELFGRLDETLQKQILEGAPNSVKGITAKHNLGTPFTIEIERVRGSSFIIDLPRRRQQTARAPMGLRSSH